MRLELLHYFVQIVESRSFNKAAARLFLTQPALTNAMNALEGELGTRLLVRSHKGVVPTAHGAVVYEDCRRILGELRRMLGSLENADRSGWGRGSVEAAGWAPPRPASEARFHPAT